MKDNRWRLLMLASLALGYCLGRKVLTAGNPRQRAESPPLPPARKRSGGGLRLSGAPRPARRPAPSSSGSPRKSSI